MKEKYCWVCLDSQTQGRFWFLIEQVQSFLWLFLSRIGISRPGCFWPPHRGSLVSLIGLYTPKLMTVQCVAVPFMRSMVVLNFGSTRLFFYCLWTPVWLSPVFTEPSAYPAGQQLLWSLRSWYIPFKLHNSPISLHSPSLFLLTIFALHKLLPEWSSRFCIEEGSHRTNLPSCCFSLRLLLSLSLFSPGSVAPTLPGLHRLRTERAGKCYLRLILFSSPFLVSPHFLCLDYCLWGQRGFYLILCR